MLLVSAVKMRIRATNNVAKLTAVMKLVASSKLRAVEDALARGRPFGVRYAYSYAGSKYMYSQASTLFAAGGDSVSRCSP